MKNDHLKDLFAIHPDIEREFMTVSKDPFIEPVYFRDESRHPHFGEGWICSYIIVGISAFAGLAASSFIKTYFSKAGEAAWDATVRLFKRVANKLKREKMFFYFDIRRGKIRLFAVVDEKALSDKYFIDNGYQMTGKHIKTIEKARKLFAADTFLLKYVPEEKFFLTFPIEKDFEIAGKPNLLLPSTFFIEKPGDGGNEVYLRGKARTLVLSKRYIKAIGPLFSLIRLRKSKKAKVPDYK